MEESQLRSFIEKNPIIQEMVETELGPKGELIRNPIHKLSFSELVERVSLEEDHIKPFAKAKIDPVTKQVLSGIDIHYPENIRLAPKIMNSSFKRRATSFIDVNVDNIDPEIKKNIKEIKKYLTRSGQGALVGEEWTGEIIGKKGNISVSQQLKNLGINIGTFFSKLPYEELVKIAKANKCPLPIPKKAEGGRIGFGAGSGVMLACIDAKWEKNPQDFLKKTAGFASKGLDKLFTAVAPLFLPTVQLALGRAEAFKDPTQPDMYWSMVLASDAIRRLGLSDAALSQLKNASLLKKADIMGRLVLKFPGTKFWKLMASKIGVPGAMITETYQALKAGPTKEKKIAEIAKRKDWNVEETLNMYRLGEVYNWDRATVFHKMFGKLPKMNWGDIPELLKRQEYQERIKYLKEHVKNEEEVTEKVTEKVELPHGTGPVDWALNMKAQMKEKEPPKYAAVDSYFMGGIASLMK